MNISNLIPKYKKCPSCSFYIFFPKFCDNDFYFFCSNCNFWFKWRKGTLLERSRILYYDLEKLILHFVNNKRSSEVIADWNNYFYQGKISANTVRNYFNLFGKIALEYYQIKMNSTLLNGFIELDETLVYTEKRTKAQRHRHYKLKSIWIIGMRKRHSKEFLIGVIKSRQDSDLVPFLLKHVEIGSTIFTDSFSIYVNNRKFPKER